MPSRRIIPGLNTPRGRKDQKPATELQRQMLELRNRDREHAVNNPAVFLMQENPSEVAEDDVVNQYQVAAGPTWVHPEVNENDVQEYEDVMNMNQYMPNPDAPASIEVEDPVLVELRQQQHQAHRLVHETRWTWQYAVMLPTFLQCRLATNNWGDEVMWKHDFRPPCVCAGKTERNVDLVDLTSKQFVFLGLFHCAFG